MTEAGTNNENDGAGGRAVEADVVEQLLSQADASGRQLVGPGGLLTELTRRVLERALDTEMSDHLGYEPGDPAGAGSGNSRNGRTTKTVLTDVGSVDITVPRDRNGTFEPAIVRKRQRRLDGLNDAIISLYARGMTVRDIRAHLTDIYGVEVSPDLISKVTDAVAAEVTEWQNRPLGSSWAVLFVDALWIKIRDGQVSNRPVYVVVGVDFDGAKHVLGMWIGKDGEGAKYWMNVLAELKNRGVSDVCFVCVDGLAGMPDAITTVWPAAIVQTSSVHNAHAGMVPVVTCTVAGRTYSNLSPSRSQCRPVRPRRWQASHRPAGAAPVECRDEVPTEPAMCQVISAWQRSRVVGAHHRKLDGWSGVRRAGLGRDVPSTLPA